MSHRCAGHSKITGEQCGRVIPDDEKVCRWHGGGAPQVRAKVERERQAKKLAQAAADFALPREIGPAEALVEELFRTAGMVSWSESQLRDGLNAELIEMHRFERTHFLRVSKTCVELGLKEREVRLAEDQGRMLAEVLRFVVADMVAALGEDLSADRLARLEREQVPAIIRQRLLPLAGGEAA